MTARRPLRAPAAVVLVVLASLLAACTVGPSERPAVLMQDAPGGSERDGKDNPAPLPPLGEPPTATINWGSCPQDVGNRLDKDLGKAVRSLTVQCASITGSNETEDLPDHGFVNIPLLKAGRGEAPKVPLVVVDDIDGRPGTMFAAELASRLPARLLKEVDVIGFDRRGTGGSNPIDCIPKPTRTELLSLDPAADDVEPLLAAIRKAGQECSIALGNKQTSYDSARTAGDLAEIQAQLGVPRLHAIARGDGSRVLTAFAAENPAALGRVVLDGVPDPSKEADGVLAEVAAGAEATLDAFAEDCAAAAKCPLGDKPREAVEKLVDELREKPAVAKDLQVGPSTALYALWVGLRSPEHWGELATALDTARDGKGERLAAFLTPWVDYRGESPPAIDAVLATVCNDTQTRLSPERIDTLLGEWREKYPVFGGLVAQRLLWCSQWPVRTKPLPDLNIPGVPPSVLVSTANDPVTPERGTTRAAGQLTGAQRVAWLGASHGALGRSDCVEQHVVRFLLDGKVPTDGITCPA